MVAIWYLLMLAPVIAIAIVWWSYRRKQAARERLANERWQQLVKKAGDTGKEGPAAVAPLPAAVMPQKTTPSTVSQSYRGRERLLEPADTLFYFLLRTQLPEYEVLTTVNLSRLLVISATSETERERMARGLSQHAVDFVLCDKAMQPRIAIDLLTGEAPAALTVAPDFKTQCFAHSGIRYVRISRAALPKRQDVRNAILGVVEDEGGAV
jgi:hypothetical protein